MKAQTTVTTVSYEVKWGAEDLKQRRTTTFGDLETAHDFFNRKQASFAVDVFEVIKTVSTTTKCLTPKSTTRKG